MNSTLTNQTTFSNDYLTTALIVLVAVSEILPFVKKNDKFNGICHTLICILRGSSCVATTVADTLETGQVNIEIPDAE